MLGEITQMIAPEGLDLIIKEIWGLPSWSVATETPHSRCRGPGFDPWGARSYTLQLRVHTPQLKSLTCHNKDRDPECCN